MPADASAVESAFAQRLLSPEEGQINPSTEQDNDPPAGANRQRPARPRRHSHSQTAKAGRSSRKASGCATRSTEVCRKQALPCVRSCAVRSGPFALCPAARPRPPGQRQFTVPLCRLHHRELHRKGDEAAWWQANKIDPIPFALGSGMRGNSIRPAFDGVFRPSATTTPCRLVQDARIGQRRCNRQCRYRQWWYRHLVGADLHHYGQR